jgi:hypothetical protein
VSGSRATLRINANNSNNSSSNNNNTLHRFQLKLNNSSTKTLLIKVSFWVEEMIT